MITPKTKETSKRHPRWKSTRNLPLSRIIVDVKA
jgi:hypothetical protein